MATAGIRTDENGYADTLSFSFTPISPNDLFCTKVREANESKPRKVSNSTMAILSNSTTNSLSLAAHAFLRSHDCDPKAEVKVEVFKSTTKITTDTHIIYVSGSRYHIKRRVK